MKARLLGLAAAFCAMVWTSEASALPFTDTATPGTNIRVSVGQSYSYQHVVADFDPFAEPTAALFTIVLSDDGGPELIRISFEGLVVEQRNTGNAAQTYAFDLAALGVLDALADGILEVTLSAAEGAYFFNLSTLSGDFMPGYQADPAYQPDLGYLPELGGGAGDRGAGEAVNSDVSEPTVLGLFGFALAALGLALGRQGARQD